MIYEEDFHDYEIQDETLFNQMPDIIWATPDSPLIYSCSSGTTGDPKKISNTHEKIYLMAQRLGELYVEKNNSILHTALIHHGASICYHFLPGFMRGLEQYTFATGGNYTPALAKFISDNKINQLFLFTPRMMSEYIKNTDPVKHKVNIVTLFQIPSDMVPLVKLKNIDFIKSPFGDTTIGLGFFLKTVDQTTNESTYDVTNMGHVLDDFFKIELRDNCLYVSCPRLNEEWATSNDQFEIIDGNYHFRGRSNQYRINGEWIKLHELERTVKNLFGLTGASIAVDPDMQKIYLAVWQENAEAEKHLHRYFVDNYESVDISYVLRGEAYNEFFLSRKIDNAKIRQVCRQHLLSKVTK
jgi:acyl-CoA synthetase (AMP-forming)/AMP-acid ligase II